MKTVIAQNSFGRDKEMDLAEFTNRAVTDHRCMASTHEQMEKAELILRLQKELAEDCFNTLWKQQNG